MPGVPDAILVFQMPDCPVRCCIESQMPDVLSDAKCHIAWSVAMMLQVYCGEDAMS